MGTQTDHKRMKRKKQLETQAHNKHMKKKTKQLETPTNINQITNK